jgi:hypothetical protein
MLHKHVLGDPYRSHIHGVGAAADAHGKGVQHAVRGLLVQRHGLQALLQRLRVSLLPLLLRLYHSTRSGSRQDFLEVTFFPGDLMKLVSDDGPLRSRGGRLRDYVLRCSSKTQMTLAHSAHETAGALQDDGSSVR